MSAGDEMSELVKNQLEIVRARRASLEGRAVAVISSAGVLVTLQLALVTAFSGGQDLSVSSRVLVGISSTFLALSCLGAILVNLPRRSHDLDPDSIERAIDFDHWSAPSYQASRVIVRARLNVLRSEDNAAQRQALCLMAAFACEMLGVGTASSAVVTQIFT
ncbi:hypothetical protein EJ357_22545 [Streptomyces cyaneochromogenes]|uniref:Integral membrane plasmid transfer protein n=1 Tax=Streptomyces cyaneochromogenes TaxID=2496836 RepID=A0A3Q9EU88_9ACTN|nr:hypothetical protein [Streptomyces cyaneochromogenes]AZQ35916.1 hypothetical protein EJ357_22545 [Streptomyces cyaneochromogenes]